MKLVSESMIGCADAMGALVGETGCFGGGGGGIARGLSLKPQDILPLVWVAFQNGRL